MIPPHIVRQSTIDKINKQLTNSRQLSSWRVDNSPRPARESPGNGNHGKQLHRRHKFQNLKIKMREGAQVAQDCLICRVRGIQGPCQCVRVTIGDMLVKRRRLDKLPQASIVSSLGVKIGTKSTDLEYELEDMTPETVCICLAEGKDEFSFIVKVGNLLYFTPVQCGRY